MADKFRRAAERYALLRYHNRTRWAAKEGVLSEQLLAAVREIERGLIDARLGGWLIKKRVGAEGRGKRGSFRTIIAFQAGERLMFLEGYAKNEKANITGRELKAFKRFAGALIELDETAIDKLVADGELTELLEHVEDS
jgi:hypothetical protein